MDTFASLALGFEAALVPTVLLYCFIGVFLGTLIGVLPGIGPLAAISLLLPITYYIGPAAAIIMIAGVYYGSQYGGSTTSILLRIPGTSSAAVVAIDGYPMTQQGRGGIALLMTTIASFAGAMIGLVILVLFAPAVAEFALNFGSAEYFAIMLLGLLSAATLSASLLKGAAMVVLGLVLSMVGTDVNSGVSRFDFGFVELYDGINLIAIAMGLFAIADIISNAVGSEGPRRIGKVSFRSMVPTRKDIGRSWPAILRGTGVGGFFGALPGAGLTMASFIAYATEKRTSRTPEEFGNGAIEGVVGPEAANNAAAQTSFVPTLSLGIPGDATMALIMGALIIHGITPGPLLIDQHPDIFWGLIASFIIGNIMLMFLNIPLIGIWLSLLRIPYRMLYPAILIFVCLGVYSVNGNPFDIYLVAIIGALGYVLSRLSFEPAPLLLGFILGPLMEEHFRRALVLSRGDITVFVERPISATILSVCTLILLWSIWKAWRHRPMDAPEGTS
ncbi:MAG: tripartite tricarboxylate transporter permease [Rhodobacteraceae bacterium]|nr:MAG: tripartite tricarboxylate transporter permease [Paracoccaceae bacterium]